jgi:hypothetical protein
MAALEQSGAVSEEEEGDALDDDAIAEMLGTGPLKGGADTAPKNAKEVEEAKKKTGCVCVCVVGVGVCGCVSLSLPPSPPPLVLSLALSFSHTSHTHTQAHALALARAPSPSLSLCDSFWRWGFFENKTRLGS